jgi:hypothetical protein
MIPSGFSAALSFSMLALILYRRCLVVYLLTASSMTFALPADDADTIGSSGYSDRSGEVEHIDRIETDPSLSLSKVVDLTLEKYPDKDWLKALEEEASTILERSQSWTAGPSQAMLGYQSMYNVRLNWVTAGVQVPLWNLGQRDAEKKLANEAEASAELQSAFTKLRVAGLVRVALWEMALAKIRHEHAEYELDTYQKLLDSIKRRVELGDLPRSDELLAQTELLQKRSVHTMAEAELMHARKRYSTITQMIKVPSIYEENLAELHVIEHSHPALAAINGQIERKQAELDAIKSIGSGQTHVVAGLLSDEGVDPRSNHAEFFNVGVNIPFGGKAHIAPQIAAINVELNRLISERTQLYRDLEQSHHEAEHNLEVSRVELKTATKQRQVSEELFSSSA